MKVDSLSVFFPLFNEEGNIETIVERAIEVLESLKFKYEIILVNDGSSDNTVSVIDKIARENTHVRVIHHPKNLGYGEALKSGFYGAKYDTIVYTDGDNQFDFSQVKLFLEKIENFDLIVGYRIKRQDPFFRILFKMGWTLSLFAFFRLTLKDIDCGFKMIKRKVLEEIPHLESQRGAMINAELVIKTKKAGFRIGQVGVNHYPRLSGKPTGASLNVIFKSYMDLVKLWWNLKEQKLLFLSIVAILILAAFLRLYRISEYMTFLGDEGRDALIVTNMIVNHHPALIGPPTSVGNIYLGPLYYYMMAGSMFFNLNPVAAAQMVAIIGVLTVFLVYYFGKIILNKEAGLISALLYAISPVNILQSRSSWNPNPAPMFTLLAMLGFAKLQKTRDFKWLILTGVMTAAAVQMHYLALILIPIFGILYFVEVFKKRPAKSLVSGTILAIIAFLIVMSPLLLFDLRHDFLNYKAVTKLFSEHQAVSGSVFSNLYKIPRIFTNNLIGPLMTAGNSYLTAIVSILTLSSIYFLSNPWRVNFLVWLLVGILGLSFYQGSVYDHYVGFLNPIPFLLFGSFLKVLKSDKIKMFLGPIYLIIFLSLIFVNLQNSPINSSPNNQLQRTKDVAKFIISKTEEKPFNFALIAASNYDAAYQFYLDQYGHKPKVVPMNKTNQLFVVCEDQVCDPTHHAKHEVAAFGYSKIDWMEEKFGVKIYKLSPNPSGKP